MHLEAGAFYVHRARASADLAGLGPSSLSRPCRRAHATDARLCRFHSDVTACSSHICIMVCLTDLMRLLLSPHSRNDRAQLQSLLHCAVDFALYSRFRIAQPLCLVQQLCIAQSLLPCTVAFALRSRFCLAQSLLPYTVAFALHSRFCLAQSLLPCTAALPYVVAFAIYSRFCFVQPLLPCTAAAALGIRFSLAQTL